MSADPVRWSAARIRGSSLDDAVFLAERAEDVLAPEPDQRETVVGRIEDGAIAAADVPEFRIASLDRAPSGRTYAAVFEDGAGLVRTRGPRDFEWEHLDVPAMQHVFALNDECVMAWAYTGVGLEQRFVLWDGARAVEIPSPPAPTMAVHGIAPDWIVAVGFGCMVARWDGRAWRPWTLPPGRALGSIHVVSPDEMYATGPTGAVFEGSQYGWTMRAATSGTAVSVTKFGDDVLVGDPMAGLLRLRQAVLERVELDTRPWLLHAGRDALLMTEERSFSETRDLRSLRRVTAEDLDAAFAAIPPGFRD